MGDIAFIRRKKYDSIYRIPFSALVLIDAPIADYRYFFLLAGDTSVVSIISNARYIRYHDLTLLALLLSLLTAFFMYRVVKGAVYYRTFLILPYAISPIIVGVLWAFMFSPSFGVIAYLLKHIGIDWNHQMNDSQAMWLVILASVWKQISYNFLFFYAGLQAIPKSLIEAAAIDGAGPWKRFFTIQLPLLWPTTFFLCVINIVYAFFDTFAIIDSLTKGGPGKSTSTLVYRIYVEGFMSMDYGSSAAQSVILMAAVLLLTLIQFRYMDQKGGH